ncbi:MAG: hypothetical protein IJF64_01535, partial [Clostridia bacterium]|nr:hypothetical protein [Clostridia bacterium]
CLRHNLIILYLEKYTSWVEVYLFALQISQKYKIVIKIVSQQSGKDIFTDAVSFCERHFLLQNFINKEAFL